MRCREEESLRRRSEEGTYDRGERGREKHQGRR
jgi:hypothetical protein